MSLTKTEFSSVIDKMKIAISLFICLSILSGCATLPGAQTARGPSGPVEISYLPGSAPTVVFEAGLGAHKESWRDVFQALSRTNAVFAYDRPGVGRSASTQRPRDGATIVEDLRALLRDRGIRPPYVLVGHSAGGLYMQLYARNYPGEVAGLVLVDPTHPTQFEGDGALAKRGSLAVGAMALAGTVGPVRQEFEALPQTGAGVLSSTPLPASIPAVILVARDSGTGPAAAFDDAKRADLARIYPTARVQRVDSDHNIPGRRPEAIVEAIRWVLSAPPPR